MSDTAKKFYTAFSIDITPEGPANLGGYATYKTADPVVRHHSKLEANGLVQFGDNDVDWIFVGLDALFCSPDLIDALHKELCAELFPDLNREQVLVVATHTHFAPMLDETKPNLGICDARWQQEVAKRVSAGIKSSIQPALHPHIEHDVYYGVDSFDGATYRRQPNVLELKKGRPFFTRGTLMLPNKEIEIPRDIRLVSVKKQDSNLAIVWSWPCHAVLTPSRSTLGSDFPGAIRAILRDALGIPELPIIYLPGFCGDIRPTITKKGWNLRERLKMPLYFGRHFRMPTNAEFDKFCHDLGNAVIRSEKTARRIEAGPELDLKRNQFRIDSLVHAKDKRAVLVPCAKFSIGSVPITCVGAEVSSSYLRRLAPSRSEPALLTGCFDACFGYLPNAAQVSEGGYEVDKYINTFSLSGHIGRRIEENFIESLMALSYDQKRNDGTTRASRPEAT